MAGIAAAGTARRDDGHPRAARQPRVGRERSERPTVTPTIGGPAAVWRRRVTAGIGECDRGGRG